MRGVLAMLLSGLSFAAMAQSGLKHEGPILRWDEAMPIGNGLLGGLLWGVDGTLKLSLDRGDLWDLRDAPGIDDPNFNYQAMQRLVKERNQGELDRLFDGPYNHAYPTKIPGGRLELVIAGAPKRFALDIHRAEATAELGSRSVRTFANAADRHIFMQLQGLPAEPKLRVPESLAKLGYEVARERSGSLDGGDPIRWFTQDAAAGLRYTVMVGWRKVSDRTTDLVVVIEAGKDQTAATLESAARRRIATALARGYEGEFKRHQTWWRSFWAISRVQVPDPPIQAHYDLVKYFHGSASRRGAPPMPLQGIWTADEGGLPPWKGDYHNDLNTQTTYLPYPVAGLFDGGLSWIEFNEKLLPTYKAFSKSFYGVEGAVIPGVMTLNGKPLGGWGMYSLSPTNGAWIAHQFYRHWRFSMEPKFLKDRAYPFCKEIGLALAGLLRPDGTLPLSSSPEIHDNTIRAWLTPNSNYDASLMRWLFEALAEMARALNRDEEQAKWSALARRIPPFVRDPEDGGLAFAKDELYRDSHRHFSHSMAVHPLGLIDVEKGDRDRQIVNATLDRIAKHGTDWWVGYSFSWFSTMLARAGRGDEALRYLRDYERAFILSNGFHANGDQTKSGLSKFHYRPFTLEGNFLAMEAVHEMLIQSHNGLVRLLPALPKEWASGSFDRLRAEGGFVVSVTWKGGTLETVAITATVDQDLRLRDPWPSAGNWSRKVVRKDDLLTLHLRAGETLIGKR